MSGILTFCFQILDGLRGELRSMKLRMTQLQERNFALGAPNIAALSMVS